MKNKEVRPIIIPTGEITLVNRKITNIHFPERHTLLKAMLTDCQRLYDANDWVPSTTLSIITGVNGIGKSQILKFLYLKLKDVHSIENDLNNRIANSKSRDAAGVPESFESEEINVLYVPHNFIPKGPSGPTKDMKASFIEDIDREGSGLKFVFMGLLDSIQKKTQPAITNLAIWESTNGMRLLHSVAIKIVNHPHYHSLSESEKIELAKEYALVEQTSIPLVATDFTLSFFISAFVAYEDLKKNIHTNNYNYNSLLNFYIEQNNLKDQNSINIDVLKEIFNGDNVVKYKAFKLKELWGSTKTPWEEVDEQLAKLYPTFKHKLVYDLHFGITFSLRYREANSNYRFEQLSTGEQMILSVLSWQYCQRGYSIDPNNNNLKKNYFKSDVILLDEPDRHFDPKLSKIFYQIIRDALVEELGIQVIMTTHRIDTIALSQEGEVFTVNKNDQSQIEITPCHKLLAMFRLTSNLREFTNHDHIVYTESRNDALFYEGVYKTLMEQSNNLRTNNEIAFWQEQGTVLDDLLSRRFQFSFMSVSSDGDSGGGCIKILEYIASDITAHKNLESYKMPSLFYDDLRLSGSYGILDNDYGKKHNHDKIYKAEGRDDVKRAVTLMRHSLENYLFDPFIFCYLLNDPRILEIVNNNIKNSQVPNSETRNNIKRTCQAIYKKIKNSNFDEIQPELDEYFRLIIFDSCKDPKLEEIYKEIKDKNWSFSSSKYDISKAKNIASDLLSKIINKVDYLCTNSFDEYNRDEHFDQLLEENGSNLVSITEKDRKEFHKLCDTIKPERILQYRIIDHARVTRDIYADGQEPKLIEVIQKDGTIIPISIKYPHLFLSIRGHDIGDGIFGEKTGKGIIKISIAKIYNEGLEFIPIDLVKTIFELNKNIRTHVREVLKPNKHKLTWSEKMNKLSSISLYESKEKQNEMAIASSSSSTEIESSIDDAQHLSKKRKASIENNLTDVSEEKILESRKEQIIYHCSDEGSNSSPWIHTKVPKNLINQYNMVATVYNNQLLNHEELLKYDVWVFYTHIFDY